MGDYQRKATRVEAIQYRGDETAQVIIEMIGASGAMKQGDRDGTVMYMVTPDQVVVVAMASWVLYNSETKKIQVLTDEAFLEEYERI